MIRKARQVSVRIQKSMEHVMMDPVELQSYVPAAKVVELSPEMPPTIFTAIGSPMEISFYALLIVLFA